MSLGRLIKSCWCATNSWPPKNLKAQLKGRLKLSDAERATLGEIGHRLGRNSLAEVATLARPDAILAWCRKLVASKFERVLPDNERETKVDGAQQVWQRSARVDWALSHKVIVGDTRLCRKISGDTRRPGAGPHRHEN